MKSTSWQILWTLAGCEGNHSHLPGRKRALEFWDGGAGWNRKDGCRCTIPCASNLEIVWFQRVSGSQLKFFGQESDLNVWMYTEIDALFRQLDWIRRSIMRPVCDELGVRSLYTSRMVAESYIENRFASSWQFVLHRSQVVEVNRNIRETRPETVLEIAPGPARLAVDLVGVKHGTMVEYSEEMISIARERLRQRNLENNWNIVHGNAFELDRLPISFDFIFTFRFIRHFYTQDRARLLRAISCRLNPGGLLLFDVVNAPTRIRIDKNCSQFPSDALPVYDVSYTEDGFREEMAANGFEVISMRPVLTRFKLQSFISSRLDDVSRGLSARVIDILEAIPSRNPLEWIAVCRGKQQ